jgi:hypothetical protein
MVMVSAGLLPMLVGIVALANKLRGSPGRSLHVTAQYVTVEAAHRRRSLVLRLGYG